MEPKIKVSVVREKSFDPTFVVKVDYDSEVLRLSGITCTVTRTPPRVTFAHPPEILDQLAEVDQKKLELEIMNSILSFIMGSAERRHVTSRGPLTL